MLGIIHYIRKFLLSALKGCSPARLLQYLLALCRAVFSRCKSKCSDQEESSHESLPKTLTLAEGKESLSEEGIVTPVGHVISACRTPAQLEEGPAKYEEISSPCVCDQLLPIMRANHHHLVEKMTNLNLRSDRIYALQVNLHSKKAYFTCGPTVRVCLTWWPLWIILDSSGVPLLILKSRT